MNSYVGLTTLKARMTITGTGDDTQLRTLMEAASRAVDNYCRRWFYAKTATRYFPGAGSTLFLPDDLLSVTTFKTDDDGDATFENTLASTDYYLYPLNDMPKIRAEINPDGNYGSFASGIQRGVEIAGLWGYGDGESATPYSDSTTTTNEALDATETAVDVVSAAVLEVGQTILVESEQMYITAISSNTLTVKRGVNGTTGATHDTSKTVYIYDYPPEVQEAVMMQTARLWARKNTAYARVIANPELGQIEVYRGMDDDVKHLLFEYVRPRYF